MSGFFRMEVKVVGRVGKRSSGEYGINDSLHAAAYIDGEEYRRTAPSAAAYISGSNLEVESGKKYDYRRKQGVEASFVVLPENAPKEYEDPQILWNAVEKAEIACNADIFREWLICFDKHLSFEERLAVAKQFAESLIEEGMAAVHVALHTEKDGNGNYHMHVLAPTRGLNEDGTWQECKTLPRRYALDEEGKQIPVIDRQTGLQKADQDGRLYWKRMPIEYVNPWNDRRAGNVRRWREVFCAIENKYLPEEFQVSPKSYREQGVDRIPGKHLGKVAFNVHRKMAAKIKGFSPEQRKEYLTRLDELLTRKNDSAEWQLEHDSLQKEIQDSMREVSKYTPQRDYIRCFRERRTQIQLEEAFSAVYQYQRHQYDENLQQEVADQCLELMEKVVQAAEDYLIISSGVLTRPMEQRLFQGEFDLKKALLEETKREIAELEKQLEKLTERGEKEYAEQIERLLTRCRETLQGEGSVGITGATESEDLGDGEGIVAAAERVSKLSEEFKRHHRELEAASRRIAEITGRKAEGRGQHTQKRVTH